MVFPFLLTNHPGAVPCGFGILEPDGMIEACLIFDWGISVPRFLNSSLRSARSLESINISSSKKLAIDSRVKSSEVGPNPPVVINKSDLSKALAIAVVKFWMLSPTLATNCKSTPIVGSSDAM